MLFIQHNLHICYVWLAVAKIIKTIQVYICTTIQYAHILSHEKHLHNIRYLERHSMPSEHV